MAVGKPNWKNYGERVMATMTILHECLGTTRHIRARDNRETVRICVRNAIYVAKPYEAWEACEMAVEAELFFPGATIDGRSYLYSATILGAEQAGLSEMATHESQRFRLDKKSVAKVVAGGPRIDVHYLPLIGQTLNCGHDVAYLDEDKEDPRRLGRYCSKCGKAVFSYEVERKQIDGFRRLATLAIGG